MTITIDNYTEHTITIDNVTYQIVRDESPQRFRLYTENLNASLITELANRLLGGANITTDIIGIWGGIVESALCVEFIAFDSFDSVELKFDRLAQLINQFNTQECCLITRESVSARFV